MAAMAAPWPPSEASQLVSVAQWSLKASDFFAALKASEEALRIFQQLGYGKGPGIRQPR